MITFKDIEKEMVITIHGDREDYLNILRALVFVQGNQDTGNINSMHQFTISQLIDDLLPDVRDLAR